MSNGSQRAWIDRHWRSLLFGVIGLLLGGVVGWWAGSATACQSCQANTAGIEALGTWVGGLGTVAAVGFAVVAFRSEEQSRRDLERRLLSTRREQDEQDLAEAQQITISFSVGSTFGNGDATELRAQVRNGTSSTEMYKLSGAHSEYGTIGYRHVLKAGDTYTQNYLFGHMNAARPASVPVPVGPAKQQWLHDHLDNIDITFELRDKRWRRRGDQLVEEITD